MAEQMQSQHYVILIKHGAPVLDATRPANEWQLAESAAPRCRALAAGLAPLRPAALFSSVEPKAAATAALFGAVLGLDAVPHAGLHEHDRSNQTGLLDAERWQATVARLFAEPDTVVLGRETASAALARFGAAIDEIIAATPGQTVAVVAHGTVIALLATARAGVDGFALWQRLELPSAVVLALPSWRLHAVVDSFTAAD